MKIFLTGISGYLGSKVAKRLLVEGYSVAGLVRKSSRLSNLKEIKSDLQLIEFESFVDISKFKKITKIDLVAHFATNYGSNQSKLLQTVECNYTLPINLLNYAIEKKVEFFVNIDTSLNQYTNIYALSKAQFRQWGTFFSLEKKIKFKNLNLQYFFGPGEERTRFISNMIQLCKGNEKEIPLTGGLQKRDFVYIEDAVDACFLCITKDIDMSNFYINYDVGSGNSLSIRNVCQKILAATNSSSTFDFGVIPYRRYEPMNSVANLSEMSRIGWHPRYSFDDGLKLTIESLK